LCFGGYQTGFRESQFRACLMSSLRARGFEGARLVDLVYGDELLLQERLQAM